MRKPSGPTRWSGEPVPAQRRATLPVFGGISGSIRTTWNGRIGAGARRRGGASSDIGPMRRTYPKPGLDADPGRQVASLLGPEPATRRARFALALAFGLVSL